MGIEKVGAQQIPPPKRKGSLEACGRAVSFARSGSEASGSASPARPTVDFLPPVLIT